MENYAIDGDKDHYPLTLQETEDLLQRTIPFAKVVKERRKKVEEQEYKEREERTKVQSLLPNTNENIEKFLDFPDESLTLMSIQNRLVQAIPNYRDLKESDDDRRVRRTDSLFVFFVEEYDLPIKELAALFVAIKNDAPKK